VVTVLVAKIIFMFMWGCYYETSKTGKSIHAVVTPSTGHSTKHFLWMAKDQEECEEIFKLSLKNHVEKIIINLKGFSKNKKLENLLYSWGDKRTLDVFLKIQKFLDELPENIKDEN
jgi:hypothetical protein